MQKMQEAGFVALVGAGPGDPGLLTLRGRELLEQADAVVYDSLVGPKLLDFCREDAEKIFAGKRAAAHSMSQEQINELLVSLGREGKRVVRLKGGDPFVFGRGGEECEALAAAGITFEVVPGITAAVAAAAYAGIPVTHRDFNSSFTLITGHEKESDYLSPEAAARGQAEGSSRIDWASIAKLPCLAFYMGVKSLPRITQNLIEHGMDPSIPAATIQWGTTPRQRTITATVATIAEAAAAAGIAAPAITVIGRVVQLRESLAWFEKRPLFGQRVIVTRTRTQASALSDKLLRLGAEVLEAPTIAIELSDKSDHVSDTLQQIRQGAYDWVIFTSVNGVRMTAEALHHQQLDARALAKVRVAAVGAATADALRQYLCIEPDLLPSHATGEGLADALAEAGVIAGARFALLRADISRPVLVQRLQEEGAQKVEDVAIYRTRPVKALPQEVVDALQRGDIQWVTFTSSSTARNFISLLGEGYANILSRVRIASIGPITTATLSELGLNPTVQAPQARIDALVDAMCEATLDSLRGSHA